MIEKSAVAPYETKSSGMCLNLRPPGVDRDAGGYAIDTVAASRFVGLAPALHNDLDQLLVGVGFLAILSGNNLKAIAVILRAVGCRSAPWKEAMSISLEAAAQAYRDAMRQTVKRFSLWYLIEGISKVVFSLTIRPFPNWGGVLASGVDSPVSDIVGQSACDCGVANRSPAWNPADLRGRCDGLSRMECSP